MATRQEERDATTSVKNPIRHLAEMRPRVPTPSREAKGLARRRATFEALRAQEDMMAPIQVQELNPVVHQTKATFTPTKTVPPRPPNPAVQHVRRPLEPTRPEADPTLEELTAEFGETAEVSALAPLTPGLDPDADVDTILNRFKGSEGEKLKQVAKSYAESEKRMRRLEQEKTLLLQQQTTPQVQPQLQQQVRVTPTFDYKKWGDTFLDRPDERVKELEAHMQLQAEQKMLELAGPLYEEAIDNRLFRKFGGVVTEDNVDLIKAMAHSEPGANRWEKIVSAVQKYQTAMPKTTITANAEVRAMEQATQTPTPQARTSGEKKMWKESALRDLLQKKIRTGEYQRDLTTRRLVDAAYREGRVIRGE